MREGGLAGLDVSELALHESISMRTKGGPAGWSQREGGGGVGGPGWVDSGLFQAGLVAYLEGRATRGRGAWM